MINSYRVSFNEQFSKEQYNLFLKELEKGFVEIPFRIAETPVFIPTMLKDQLIAAGAEIIAIIKDPNFKSLTEKSIPMEWKVPNESAHPHFLTFDFGICKDQSGKLSPKLIELQGFPSLYGFQSHLAKTIQQSFKLSSELTPYFEGLNEQSYLDLLKEVIIGKHKPHEVALMDINAPQQKTAIDFLLTAKYLGLKILSLSDLKKEGNHLYYLEDGKKVVLKRIYNRLIFDEIGDNTEVFRDNFDPREALDIEWITHPNWFYRISKYTMPFLKGDFVPTTHFLNDLKEIPEDLENYVLKPLFSFAGLGVIIDVEKKDIEHISDPENWILQKKVDYEPAVQAPDGGIKVEIRLMYLWPEEKEPVLCISLVRLSRGKMIGVRYNNDFDWVGGTVGLMEK
ncbi:ATP-grasp domain-containing protein [Pedobacter gandavensis]|uniref:Circularly permuted type 2 ATP-grasp protein n=1 Tax=Pedobacter gandavensis TaxID=2679963 RepID=A0ABR6EXH2_9SPHI|nr:hypothetical protein [Pedobacter gandavensis]MBB2149990.1 hypothetical protein [Pedobacter gandavensis]